MFTRRGGSGPFVIPAKAGIQSVHVWVVDIRNLFRISIFGFRISDFVRIENVQYQSTAEADSIVNHYCPIIS